MPDILAPGSIISMTSEAADRLIRLDSGDAALLYLHFLRRGDAAGLSWTQERVEAALEQLKKQGLAPSDTPVPVQPQPEPPPPEYTAEDINSALSDTDSSFSALCDEVERMLGKKLTMRDMKQLFALYDYKLLPPEVILTVVTWCIEEEERKRGEGHRPTLSRIRSEGFAWARQGVETLEQADEHLRRLSALRTREQEVLKLLNIDPRPLIAKERSYVEAWDDMGFKDDALVLAYEKTIMKKHNFDWNYMNGILRSWHQKGLHTPAAVEAYEKQPRSRKAAGTAAAKSPAEVEAENQRAMEDMERTRHLLELLNEEG